MRKAIALVLFLSVVLAFFITLFNRRSRAPIELELVSATSLGSINGKKFARVTVNLINRTHTRLLFYDLEVEAKAGGKWIWVDQGMPVNGGTMYGGQTNRARFRIAEGEGDYRLRVWYYVSPQQYSSPRRQALDKLGPWAVSLVGKFPRLNKWVDDELEPGEKELVFEVKIPPSAGTTN